MGLLGNIVSYQLGKRSAHRKRGRQERRAEFLEEWRKIQDPENWIERDEGECDCQH